MPGDATAEFSAPANALGASLARPVLRAENLRKEFKTGRGTLLLFDELNFAVAAGDLVAIIGESGAGKSSLLHILGALDSPTSGNVQFSGDGAGGVDICGLQPRKGSEFRNREIGYVWQAHYLLPEFTALENVAMPLLARGEAHAPALAKARERLAEVELADRADHRSGELSGGEQQRVSLARALVTQPKLLLADEPTGDLDHRTAEVVFSLIQRLHSAHGLTSILVTHNPAFARRCGRVFHLHDHRMEEISPATV